LLASTRVHSDVGRRPETDLMVLKDVSERLEAMLHACQDAVPA
jgi:hypothetical protein